MKKFLKLAVLVLGLAHCFVSGNDNIAPTEDLTKKMREEYANCVTACRAAHTDQVFDNSFSYVLINEQSSCSILYAIFKELSAELGIEIPSIFVYKGTKIQSKMQCFIGDGLICNAVALQTNAQDIGQVILGEWLFTHPTLALTYSELKAIIAHELAHLKHQHNPQRHALIKKIGVVNTVRTIATLGLMYQYSHDLYERLGVSNHIYKVFGKEYSKWNRYNLINYAVLTGTNIIYLLGSSLLSSKIARAQEKEADITSVSIHKDGKSLISGVEKIEKMSKKIKSVINTVDNGIETILSDHPLAIDREDYLSELSKD